MSSQIEMRFMRTEEDLQRWDWFLSLMDSKGLITVLEKSKPYKNHGESLLYRQYIKIKLNINE
ncbi:MAG: hypothetical protein KME55_30170 [Nostoc indistinguendum CM1-VF10]|jgi:hypothetical protein|nr:hypothetical protein [Nostoc indistinguendum CM1-VF10]